jgi:branched-chain amino acid aminotransferase
MKVFIDGKFCDERDAKVSVFDHGLLYGDGIFEGIRAYNGRVFRLKEHIDRLFYSAKAILLTIPMSHEEISKAVVESCRKNKIRDGYIRLVVTRGIGTLGLNPNRCKNPSVIVIADKIQLYPPKLYQRGMEIITVPTTRNLHSALNPAIKSLNYLNNILAKIEATNAGCLEALMLNHKGEIAECTGDNIFTVVEKTISTPPKDAGILEGITRGAVIELARAAGYTVVERAMDRHDVYTASECFLTGTAAELIPVVECDGRIVGSGRPGPVTRDLRQRFQSLIRGERTGTTHQESFA